jgi:HTH-type transcriptional regulator / antitoxin HigA
MKNIKPLHTHADYEWALEEVESYFKNTPAAGSEDADRFDVLSALLEQYEDENFEIPDADPIEVLHFAMESMGRTQSDLAKLLNSSPRASEVLNRRRKLTLDMIRTISENWKIPIEALTDDYELMREYA